jgi:uncharacterized membrane protein YkgB
MGVYDFLVNTYNQFIGVFPPSIQWVVTLLILLGLIGAFLSLVQGNLVALILVVVLLPFLIPALQHFLTDIYNFFKYLLEAVKVTGPNS